MPNENPSRPRERTHAPGTPPGRSEDEVFEEYVERINAGEQVDYKRIRELYPEFAGILIEELQLFEGITPRPAIENALSADRSDEPLGTLGDYTLRRRIGRGGMGVVYEAWEGSMDRRVALKVLPTVVAGDERAVARFIREAQAAGRLNHPNVVAVHGMGVKDRSPYFAMEYVEGETLAQALRRLGREGESLFGTTPQHQDYYVRLAQAFSGVADGLQHAHSNGVVHRDVKPSNVILDSDGRLRILDFGLARLEGQESLTVTGDFVGTPAYMSPEQAKRWKVPVDHRTDIYSLGATLYELLTRERPFRGKDYQDTLSRIIERDPRPPGQLNPRIPTNLETIVLKCLRKEPADRYGTAEALGQDLSRFARGDAIEARPEAPWERLSRRAWRHRAALTSAVLALMLGLLGLSVSNVLIARARDQARRDLYVAHMGLAHETWEASNMGRFKSLLEAQRPEDGQLDRRGWEWYYLHGLLRPEHLTIEAHSDRVRSVAWSPDGGLLASAGGEGTVKLWNAATGKEVRTLKESSAGVISVAWDSRGERLAAGDAAGRVDIWTAATGEKTFSVLAHPNPDPEGHPGGGAISLAWSPDGRYLASGGSDRVGVKVWDVAAGATVFEVPESEWVWSVTWRPDGRQLAAAVNSEKVIVWDAATWQEVGAWQESRYSIYSLAWSPDGRELGWNAKGRINIREQETGIERLRLGAPGEAAYSFVWSPAGDRLAGAGQDGVVRVWDTTTGEALQNLRGHAGRVWSVSWSPDGQYLASGSFDGTIKVWDTAIDPDDMLVASRSGCAAWSPDGEYLALPGPANGPDQVRILDVESLEERHTFPLGPRSAAVRAVAWSPGSRRVASRHQPGTVSVWSLDSGGQLWRVPDPEPGGEVRGKLAWSPDGRHLASTNSTSVKIWNAATGELMRVLTGHTAQLGSLAWSPDGQHLATASWHQAIKIWDTSTWKELQHLQRHPFSSHGSDGQHAVAWSPDGDRLAAGGCEGALIIWETATWSELHRIQGHPVNVRAVSWSSDGLRIATGSSDRTVKIWEAETGQELLTLRGHVHPVRSVEWSPDSERLVTADSRTVRIWDAPGYVEGELTESEH